MSIRDLRLQRGWSQEELAERSGLSVRTIQRIENGQTPGLASANALAGVFEVEVAELGPLPPGEPDWRQQPFVAAVRTCLVKFAVFDGRATRAEYWWFMLFVALVVALGTVVHEVLGSVVLLLALLPMVAAGSRRLHDVGHSGWWQLFGLAPFGFVVPLVLLVQPTSQLVQAEVDA